jgi:hypothetical protein
MNRPLYFEYPVQVGDTLPALIQSVYGSSPSSCHHEDVLQTLQALNPHLRTNPPLPFAPRNDPEIERLCARARARWGEALVA